ncbi:MAG TPA: anti-sigma factor, partial [Ktedonobacterales bacterium]
SPERDETLEQLAALLANPESLVWEVAGTDEAPGARGQLVGVPGGREAVLVTAGLAPLAPGQAYQVWLLREGTPVPNALFQVRQGGEGSLVVRSATRLRDVDVIAVTPEPASGSPAPTGPIVLAGQLAA